MLVGYARISTTDQTLNLQHDALAKAGCTKIFTDTASGALAERKGLLEALDYVRAGDTLVVWRLDRLGRSLKDLITRITELETRKIGFKSLTENIDTTTSGGEIDLSHFRSAGGIRAGHHQGADQRRTEGSQIKREVRRTTESTSSREDQTGQKTVCGYEHVCCRDLQNAWNFTAYAAAVCERVSHSRAKK
jgi:DNA invertase Pin-like site-specific DNA recombinase